MRGVRLQAPGLAARPTVSIRARRWVPSDVPVFPDDVRERLPFRLKLAREAAMLRMDSNLSSTAITSRLTSDSNTIERDCHDKHASKKENMALTRT